jgi:hypothetical protein
MKINNKLRIKAVKSIIFKHQHRVEYYYFLMNSHFFSPVVRPWIDGRLEFHEESLEYWEAKLKSLEK